MILAHLLASIALAPRPISLTNAQFEEPAKLSPGQSQVKLGEKKFIMLNANDESFSRSISGIPGWQIAITDMGSTHADIGLECPAWSTPEGNHWMHLNRWNHVAWQQTAEKIKPGVTYTLTVDVSLSRAFSKEQKAGTVQLIAGAFTSGTASDLSYGSTIVCERTVATPAWDGQADTLFESLDLNEVQKLKLTFKAERGSAALLKNLTVAVYTNEKSTGPTYWDNFKLEASQ